VTSEDRPQLERIRKELGLSFDSAREPR